MYSFTVVIEFTIKRKEDDVDIEKERKKLRADILNKEDFKGDELIGNLDNKLRKLQDYLLLKTQHKKVDISFKNINRPEDRITIMHWYNNIIRIGDKEKLQKASNGAKFVLYYGLCDSYFLLRKKEVDRIYNYMSDEITFEQIQIDKKTIPIRHTVIVESAMVMKTYEA